MEKTAEEILKKNCVFDKFDLRFASVKYYAESGSLSGSLYTAIKDSMEEYASQFKQPDGGDAISFHLWMKENDTPERAAEWFHYSDEDMYKVFKTTKP